MSADVCVLLYCVSLAKSSAEVYFILIHLSNYDCRRSAANLLSMFTDCSNKADFLRIVAH